jgi:ribulose-phosphate 3-epimerase
MAEIIPSIIARDFAEVKKKIASVEALVTWAQVDIMDGRFVLPSTWAVAEDLYELPGQTKIEAHLMVEQPEDILPEWLKYADRILVHYESTNIFPAIAESFTGHLVELGVVLNLDTPLAVLENLPENVKVVQLMSINKVGYQGEDLNEEIFARIKTLRKMLPNVKISIDGGVTLENARALVAAGADNLIVGSAIWQASNVAVAIKELQDAVNR